jgi:hypothetical protein
VPGCTIKWSGNGTDSTKSVQSMMGEHVCPTSEATSEDSTKVCSWAESGPSVSASCTADCWGEADCCSAESGVDVRDSDSNIRSTIDTRETFRWAVCAVSPRMATAHAEPAKNAFSTLRPIVFDGEADLTNPHSTGRKDRLGTRQQISCADSEVTENKSGQSRNLSSHVHLRSIWG